MSNAAVMKSNAIGWLCGHLSDGGEHWPRRANLEEREDSILVFWLLHIFQQCLTAGLPWYINFNINTYEYITLRPCDLRNSKPVDSVFFVCLQRSRRRNHIFLTPHIESQFCHKSYQFIFILRNLYCMKTPDLLNVLKIMYTCFMFCRLEMCPGAGETRRKH